ncbi:MAG: alpha/beta hydrolase [Acutalibacteraceae bacterium]|nr:alpha/beta hydrolase [Acutalibacteraceae bacterium]
MKKNTKRILITAGVASVVGAAAAYFATANYLLKVALSRSQPKAKEKRKQRLTGSDDFSKMLQTMMDAATELEKESFEDIEIESHDGIKLAGHWYCPKNPKRVLIAVHGWRSRWSQDFGVIAPFWHKNDCAVLYVEQRAQGNSEGEYMGFGLLERFDCFEWTKWVADKIKGKLPVYLCGVSMGATTVLMTAGFTLPDCVKGIIADCGFTSPHAIWKHVAQNNLKIPYGLYGAVVNDMCRKRIQASSDGYSCIEAMQNCTVPVLFAHGTDDKFVPIEMTFENYKACASPKQLFIVPGAAHGMSYFVDKDGYEAATLKFFKEYDG